MMLAVPGTKSATDQSLSRLQATAAAKATEQALLRHAQDE
jgi:hypothetical protein